MTEQSAQPASEAVPTEEVRNAAPARNVASADAVGAPSTVRTVPNLVQVQVDQWGHRGEYLKGQVIDIADLDPKHYDHEHAVRVGAVRRLTEAEARSWPLTTVTNADGSIDEDHRRAMRYGAGIADDLPRTVTTESGPAEPAEFAKPTIAYTGENAPSPRPIIVGTALEAETEGTMAGRTEATPAGQVPVRRARKAGDEG